MSYQGYIDDVLAGRVVVGKLVRQAVERFCTMADRSDIEIRHDRIERVVNLFRLLHHFKGRHAGKPFILEPWQEFAVAGIFGLYYKDTDHRVCRNVYIEIARKNGKTAFGAGLALYALMADGEAGAEVDLGANSKEQAKIAFEFARNFARVFNEEGKKPLIKPYRDELKFALTDSKMKVFASEAATLDGYDASTYLLDEYHAAPNSELRDVLQSSQAGRANPLGIIITTAGFNLDGPCYQYRTMCTEVLEGVAEDDSLFALIYSLDDDDDWTDPSVWAKCAPNLGKTVYKRFYQDAIKQASNDKSAEVGIRTKTFNQWVGSSEVWIPNKYIIAGTHDARLLDVADPNDLDCVVYGGIDLASTSDLTASATMVERDGVFHFWVDYYLPEEAVVNASDIKRYDEWAKRGYIQRTPGNVTDYNYILKDLLGKDKACQYRRIGYDQYNSTQFVISAEDNGLPMRPYSQTIGNFNRPTREFERLILSGKAKIHNNPVTRFCLRNVVLRQDHNGNIKPDKSKASQKIDGVVAMIMALGVYLENPTREFGI